MTENIIISEKVDTISLSSVELRLFSDIKFINRINVALSKLLYGKIKDYGWYVVEEPFTENINYGLVTDENHKLKREEVVDYDTLSGNYKLKGLNNQLSYDLTENTFFESDYDLNILGVFHLNPIDSPFLLPEQIYTFLEREAGIAMGEENVIYIAKPDEDTVEGLFTLKVNPTQFGNELSLVYHSIIGSLDELNDEKTMEIYNLIGKTLPEQLKILIDLGFTINEFEIPLSLDENNKLIVDIETLRKIVPQQKPEELNE